MRTTNVQLSYLQLHSILREPKPCHNHGHVHTGLARRLRVRIVLHSDDNDCTHMRVQTELDSTPAHIHIQVEFWNKKVSRWPASGYRCCFDSTLAKSQGRQVSNMQARGVRAAAQRVLRCRGACAEVDGGWTPGLAAWGD
jgi:hypothetical protein